MLMCVWGLVGEASLLKGRPTVINVCCDLCLSQKTVFISNLNVLGSFVSWHNCSSDVQHHHASLPLFLTHMHLIFEFELLASQLPVLPLLDGRTEPCSSADNENDDCEIVPAHMCVADLCGTCKQLSE